MRLLAGHHLGAVLVACLLLGAILSLGGCCAGKLKFGSCPPSIDLHVVGNEQLNSCIDQGSFQVMIRVYCLTDTDWFNDVEFNQLWFEPVNIEGDVLEVLNLTVEPGSVQSHKWTKPPGTRALGVVANFCKLDVGCWKQVIELDDRSQRVDLELEGTCLTLTARR